MKRFLIFYFIVTFLVLAIDFYAFQAVKAASKDFSASGKKIFYIIYWSFTVFTVAALTTALFIHFESWPRSVRAYVFSTILLVSLAKIIIVGVLLLGDISRLIQWLGNSLFKSASDIAVNSIPRSKFLGQLALLVGGIPLALGIHGMIRNAYNYKIHRVKIKLPHLPDSFNGLKIVQISDIHSGSFTSVEPVKRGVEMIIKEEADIVFFTGDIVNYAAHEMTDFMEVFNKVKARDGVYSTFGNHDYAEYVRYDSEGEEVKAKRSNREALIEIHKNLGWDLLLNENRILRRGDDTLAIIGVENWSAKPYFPKKGDLPKAMAGCENADVKLLLSHDPTHWDAEVIPKYKDIDITFSGHTHGAQLGIEIPGWLRWSPSQYIYKQWAGLYQEANQYLYVNRGFGFLGFHGRIGILPEITVMELEKG